MIDGHVTAEGEYRSPEALLAEMEQRALHPGPVRGRVAALIAGLAGQLPLFGETLNQLAMGVVLGSDPSVRAAYSQWEETWPYN